MEDSTHNWFQYTKWKVYFVLNGQISIIENSYISLYIYIYICLQN